jgi:hypothetical protein
MAVSQNTQNGMYARHANETHYCETRTEADAMASGFRMNKTVRMVRVIPWNNGTRRRPITEYKVMVWNA